MVGVRKLPVLVPPPDPPANLWEVLERGRHCTFPIHTAIWLFKNAQGGLGAFNRLPGPEFGYRARDSKTRSTDPNNAGVTLQALSWFMCQPAYGKGYLPSGPTAPVYGGLSEGFLEPPISLPARPIDMPPDVQELLQQATFPLTDLPTLTPSQIHYYITLRFIKHSTIFGPMECQLLRRAEVAAKLKRVPDNIERDLERATARAVQAFDVAPLHAWSYDMDRQEEFIRGIRCRRRVKVQPGSNAPHHHPAYHQDLEPTSPYSPPYLGLPIFDLRPFFQEALRLVKVVPEKVERCPELPFMGCEDWHRLHSIVIARRFLGVQGGRSRLANPSKADQQSAWEWIESMYGIRVRAALYPSDRSHH